MSTASDGDGAEPAAGFVHAPLARPTDLRLVEVFPPGHTGDGGLSLRLHVKEAAKTEYAALSYTWGDAEDVVEVEVEGRPFRITRNLEAALLRYREEVRRQIGTRATSWTWPPLLWVDGLSVNQDDADEKSAQVARMTTIYDGAQRIYCWLGPEADLSSLAFAKMRAVVDRYGALTAGQPSDEMPRWAAPLLGDELMLCDDDEEDAAIWAAVQCLFARPWWSRVWVAQEATTRSPTWLACGAEKMDLDDVLTFALLVALYEETGDEDAASRVFPLEPYVYALEDLRAQRCGEGPESELLNMLMSCRPFEASDARDKVYGVLGMVSPRGSARLLPDYGGRDLVDVYTDVVQYHVGTASSYGDKLDFLGGDGLPEGGMTGLPSWLPDWRFRHQYHVPFRKFFETAAITPRPGQKGGQGGSSNIFAASGSAEDVLKLNIDLDRLVELEGRRLKVKGYQVGYIYDVQPVFQPSSEDAIETWKTAVRGDNETGVGARYFTGESELEAFNKLLVAGMVREGMEPVARTPVYDPDDPDYGGSGGADDMDAAAASSSPPFEHILIACSGRRFGRVVQKDWNADGMALLPQSVREGDQVFVLLGGQVLYVLRSAAGGMFQFVGECYVHGLMDGEVLDILGTGLAKIRDLVIR